VTAATRIQALRAKTVANGCSEPEARSAAEKVSELLAGATPPALRREPDMASEVLAVLTNLGYRMVNAEERHPRRYFVESDDAMHHMVNHLRAVTQMGTLPDAADWFRRLCAGRKIMLPERHPSGLKSQEAPHQSVQPLGAGTHTPARSC
jgi:hypothetical protein